MSRRKNSERRPSPLFPDAVVKDFLRVEGVPLPADEARWRHLFEHRRAPPDEPLASSCLGKKISEMSGMIFRGGNLLCYKPFTVFSLTLYYSFQRCFIMLGAGHMYIFNDSDPKSVCDVELSIDDCEICFNEKDVPLTDAKTFAFSLRPYNDVDLKGYGNSSTRKIILTVEKSVQFMLWVQGVCACHRDFQQAVMNYLSRQVTRIQSCYRGYRCRRAYRMLLKSKHRDLEAVKIQKCFRGYMFRRRYRKMRAALVTIQSAVRQARASKEYAALLESMKIVQNAILNRTAQRTVAELKAQANRRRLQSRRTNIVNELLSTEEVYVEQLDIAIRVFKKPMEAIFLGPMTTSSTLLSPTTPQQPYSPPTSPRVERATERRAPTSKKENQTITAEDLAVIFSNIPQILDTQNQFLAKLKQILETWNEKSRIGGIMNDLADRLKIYVQYCNNYDQAIARCEVCKENPKFEELLMSASGVKVVKKLSLLGLLITPVQRIPRYNLLLKDLIKYTWPEHEDYQDLNVAIGRIQEFLEYLNLERKNDENRRKNEQMTRKFTDDSGADFLQIVGDSQCLGEGKIDLIVGDSRLKAYLFIFEDGICVAKRWNAYEKGKMLNYRRSYRFMEPLAIPYTDITGCVADTASSATDFVMLLSTTDGKVHKYGVKSQPLGNNLLKILNDALLQFKKSGQTTPKTPQRRLSRENRKSSSSS